MSYRRDLQSRFRFVLLTAILTTLAGSVPSHAANKASTVIVPLQAIRVADDDGGRRTMLTPAEVGLWVDYANTVFSTANISFSFDPNSNDFSDIHSTLLNNMTGVGDPNWSEARSYANAVAATYPGKLVVFCRWGPGASPTGGGFSWWDYNFAVIPGFDTSVCSHQNISLFAHETGHYLGLPHTFAGTFQTIGAAESYYLSNNRNPFVFDGDGIVDTFPDPFIWPLQCSDPELVTLSGDAFSLQTDNIMTYWDNSDKTLTADQIDRVRWLLELRSQLDMAMPTNYATPNTLEFDELPVVATTIEYYAYQDMSGFGLDLWAENDHLFCGASANESITFRIVLDSDTYNLDLYATSAPDFGIIQVWWDGVLLRTDIDLYAPLVIPTGKFVLGTVSVAAGEHFLHINVIGRNIASSNYLFGLDAIAVEPVGCHCDDVSGGCRAAIGFLTTCITGPAVSLAEGFPDCENLCGTTFDADGDQDVDLLDVSVWLQELAVALLQVDRGENVPVGLPSADPCTSR